jgi:hypothetical protein
MRMSENGGCIQENACSPDVIHAVVRISYVRLLNNLACICWEMN